MAHILSSPYMPVTAAHAWQTAGLMPNSWHREQCQKSGPTVACAQAWQVDVSTSGQSKVRTSGRTAAAGGELGAASAVGDVVPVGAAVADVVPVSAMVAAGGLRGAA